MKRFTMIALLSAFLSSTPLLAAGTVPDGFVVNQKVSPTTIFSVQNFTVAGKDTGVFQVLRGYIDVTAEGSLCGADNLAMELQQTNRVSANEGMETTYELHLKKTKTYDVKEPTIGCASSQLTQIRIPLVLLGYGVSGKYDRHVIHIQTEMFGAPGEAVIQATLKNGDWVIETSGFSKSAL